MVACGAPAKRDSLAGDGVAWVGGEPHLLQELVLTRPARRDGMVM